MEHTTLLEAGIDQLNERLEELLEISKTGPGAVGELFLRVLGSLDSEAQNAVGNAYRVLELATLNRIGQSLSSAATMEVDNILRLVYEQTSQLMDTKNFYVALSDQALSLVSFPLAIENGKTMPQEGDWAPRTLGKGLTEFVLRTEQPLLIESNFDGWMVEHSHDVDRIGHPAQCWLGVPVIIEDKVVGVFAVQNYEREYAYDRDDLNVLSTIASQAAVAISNSRLIRELKLLREVGQAITSTIELPEVLSRVVEGARAIMGADVVALYPYANGEFERPIISGASRDHAHDPLPRPGGVASRVLEQGYLPIEDPVEIEKADSRFVREEGIQSFAGIALKVGGQIVDGEMQGGAAVGVLYINFRNPHRFSERERNTMHLFATQAAIAIYNAQLFDSDRQRLMETERLAEVTQRILASPIDPRRLLQEIADQALAVLRANLVVLYIYHEDREHFDLPTIRAGRFLVPDFPEHAHVDENDIAFKIVKRREAYYAPQSSVHKVLKGVDSTRRPSTAQPFVLREQIVSSAGVPLIAAEETVGVLFVNYRSRQSFDRHQRAMIEIFANNAAIAVQNARLFERVKADLDRRIEEFDALADVDKAITTENLDTVLERILKAALKIVGSPNGNVMLVDESGRYLEVRAISGEPWPRGVEKRFKIGERGVSGWVAQQRRSALIADVRDPEWRGIYIGVLKDTLSELATPLLDEKQQLLGVVNLESSQLGAFDEEDQRLLEALAGRAMIAIQNQRRFQRETQLRRELEYLSEVVRTINSTTDLQRVLDMILEKGLELMDVPTGNIMLYDKVHGDLWMAAHRGVVEEHQGARQALGEGVVGKAAAEKRCYLVDDIRSPDWSDVYRPFIPGMRSELAVPMLVAEEELIGILNAESPKPGDFDARDQRLLKHLADHAVIAIRNAEQFQRLEALRDIDQAIISAQEVAPVFELIMDYALQLTRAEIGELRLVERRTGDLVVVARRPISGVPVDKAWERIPRGKGILGWCVDRAEAVVVPDTSKDKRYIPYFQDMKSEAAVPLLQDVIAVGVLSLESPLTNTFDQQDLDWLKALAGQAVVAMQNISRLEQARANRDLLADLHQAGQELGRISDISQLQEAYNVVLRIANAHTKTHRPVIRRYDPSTQTLVAVNPPPAFSTPLAKRISIEDGASGQAFRELRTIAVPDVANPPAGIQAKPSDPSVRSVIMTPIHFEDHKYGTLGLSYLDVHDYVEADTNFIEGLAQQLGITIHRLEAAEARRLAIQRVREAELMTSIGQSAFELVHRLGNDLGLIKSYVNMIHQALTESPDALAKIDGYLESILADVGMVRDITPRLKHELARSGADEADRPDPIVVPPRALLQEAANSVPGLSSDVEIRFDIASDVASVRVDHGQVADILRNLFANAIEAIRGRGAVTLRARNVGQYVEIQVIDTGVGIPADHQARVFDLFYSTKGSFGFGLWSARRNALANGGDLSVSSQPGRGATFSLMVPRADMINGERV